MVMRQAERPTGFEPTLVLKIGYAPVMRRVLKSGETSQTRWPGFDVERKKQRKKERKKEKKRPTGFEPTLALKIGYAPVMRRVQKSGETSQTRWPDFVFKRKKERKKDSKKEGRRKKE